MQNFSLHTHTIGFDGQNSVEEMVSQAQNLGWSKIGISNHFIVHPDIKKAAMYEYALCGGYSRIYSDSFDEAIDKFIHVYAQIDQMRQKAGLPILKGMEVDFFDTDEWRAGFEKAVDILKPDYVIGAAHFVQLGGKLLNTHDMKRADKQTQDLILKKYWHNVRQAAKSGYFDFMAHLDLPAKAGLGHSDEWRAEEQKTIHAIAACGVQVEINTSSLRKRPEVYPSCHIMKLLAKYGVPVLLSDDAHAASQLGWHYERAERLAREAGIKDFVYPVQVADYSKRRICVEWLRQNTR